MKRFVREILADAAILSGLITLPIAFLGPGWRPKDTDYNPNHGRPNGNLTAEQPEGGFAPPEEAKPKDRYIPILHAFPTENRDR